MERTRREAAGTVGIVGRADQARLLAKRQLRHTLVPATDELANSNAGTEGLPAVTRRVELASVRLESTDIVHVDRVTGLGEVLAVARRNSLNLNTHC